LAGIYIHIPFCKRACHYCNFHFSTSLRNKNELVAALLKEIELTSSPALLHRVEKGAMPHSQGYIDEEIETIYFGGGTPSLCTTSELKSIIDKIKSNFEVSAAAEITLEANPDDIAGEVMKGWKTIGINRLSIGVQSFFEEDLVWMNRAHNAEQATGNLQLAIKYFDNISIDLIYGHPLLTNEKWKQNVEKAIALNIPHLSCYALTVEQKTPLYKMMQQHKTENIDADKQAEQFVLLMQWLMEAGYEHYEISNFSKPGWRSRHNSSYWQGKKYIGIGPSAHSFDGISRQWNVSNNRLYIDSINQNIIPFEKEELTETQKLNEYIMISIRTMEGLALNKMDKKASIKTLAKAQNFINSGKMILLENSLRLTNEGKLLADGIATDLFF